MADEELTDNDLDINPDAIGEALPELRDGPNDDLDPSAYDRRDRDRMVGLIDATERIYRDTRGIKDVRNLAYWRGDFWSGDGYDFPVGGVSGYGTTQAVQNEVFPIFDTMVSGLALKLPQVELADHRVHAGAPPPRDQDPSYFGKRVARALNVMAELREFDDTVAEAALCSLTFAKGGIVKTTWDVGDPGVEWTSMLPWEVFFDPGAKRLRSASWAFERFPLHWEDYKQRILSGVYDRAPGYERIRPDVVPRSLVEDVQGDPEEREKRIRGLREYVLIHEFTDFRRGVVYHIHAETKTLLMATPLPHGNPYSNLTLNFGIGRVEGVCLADLLAPGQTNINELVNARMDMVRTLMPKILADRGVFANGDEFENWKRARVTDVTLVDRPKDLDKLQDGFAVTPAPQTTPDFKSHLADEVEHLRYLAGLAGMDRGQVQNIRTAAEAESIRQRVDMRMEQKSGRVVRMVTGAFRTGLRALQHAVENCDELGWDPQGLYAATVTGIPYEQWRDEVTSPEARFGFRVLPFSPLMEDPITRRKYLDGLLKQIAPQLDQQFDQREVAREVVETFQLRPSLVPPEEVKPPAPEGTPGGAPGGAPGGMPGGMDPAALMAGLAGGGGAPPVPGAPGPGAGAPPSVVAAKLPIPPEAQQLLAQLPPEVAERVQNLAQQEALRHIEAGGNAPPLPPIT